LAKTLKFWLLISLSILNISKTRQRVLLGSVTEKQQLSNQGYYLAIPKTLVIDDPHEVFQKKNFE